MATTSASSLGGTQQSANLGKDGELGLSLVAGGEMSRGEKQVLQNSVSKGVCALRPIWSPARLKGALGSGHGGQ